MMLQVKNLSGGYVEGSDILQGVDLDVAKGESVGIIGLNGSGKSSLAKAILNILPYCNGEITYAGADITGKSTQELSEMGIALFMQGGRVFDELSVYENLLFAAKSRHEIDSIREYFVFLRRNIAKLHKMRADKLSGGERHQLALAMTVLREPTLLILDEPSAGLSPLSVDEIYFSLGLLRERTGLTTILIEQNVARAVEFCNRVEMLQEGRIGHSFSAGATLHEISQKMFNN